MYMIYHRMYTAFQQQNNTEQTGTSTCIYSIMYTKMMTAGDVCEPEDFQVGCADHSNENW